MRGPGIGDPGLAPGQRIANVVLAEPAFEPSTHRTTALAAPGVVFDRIDHVQDTLPLPSAISGVWRAATVETRPDGRVTAIEQVAPADVRAAIVSEPPIGAGDGIDVKRTTRPDPAVTDPPVGRGVEAGAAEVDPVPQR